MLMKVFVTGGPRSGTTLCAHIFSALGCHNKAKILNSANAEDKYFEELINNLNLADSSDLDMRRCDISQYFYDYKFVASTENIYLKYPMLTSLPAVEPCLKMEDNKTNYGFVAKEFLSHFDIIIYVERDSVMACKSELAYLTDICALNNIEVGNLDSFSGCYIAAHANTYRFLYEMAYSQKQEHKIHRIRLEDILNDPSNVLAKFGDILQIDIDKIVESVILKTLLTSTKEDRAAPELYLLLCTFLGEMNRQFNRFQSSEISYSEYMSKLFEMQSFLASH